VLQQEESKENVEEEQEDTEESEEVSSSLNPNYSDVNSREYTAGKVFERLTE
jgi:hypothetical protein